MSKQDNQERASSEFKIERRNVDPSDHEFFVEGVHSFALKGTNMRMDFFTIDRDAAHEYPRRNFACRLVMPVPLFIDFARSIGQQATQIAVARRKRDSR